MPRARARFRGATPRGGRPAGLVGAGGRGGPPGGIAHQGKLYFSNRGTSRGKVAGIPFGSPGSYRMCLRKAHHVPGRMRHGYCANRYHEATGRWPGRRGRGKR